MSEIDDDPIVGVFIDLFSGLVDRDCQKGLRATLEAAGGSLGSLTVLAAQNDPFRVDTDANHRDGQWLADKLTELRLTGPRHLRGLHYALIGEPKPNGQPYSNTDEDWTWLAAPAKAARWLGYIPFDRIVDQRNDDPVVKLWTPPNPEPYIWTNVELQIPDDPDNLRPTVGVTGFHAAQPYKLVLVGEKSSLRPALSTIANNCRADLYLPTGEISDTQLYQMARVASEDGRPMAVLYFSDCDPSGWQMPISLSRKLQALKAVQFHDMEFEVHRVGLTPDQVREYGLPSTPLKATEKRAYKWQEAMEVEQTEIDALAALRPELLNEIASQAASEFFDPDLDQRVMLAEVEWQGAAQRILDAAAGGHLDQLRADAVSLLAAKRGEIQRILDTVRVDPDSLGIELPTPVLPEATVYAQRTPLCDSRWRFSTQCHELIASKQYRRRVEQ